MTNVIVRIMRIPAFPNEMPRFHYRPIKGTRHVGCLTKLAKIHFQLAIASPNTKVTFTNRMGEKGLGADFYAAIRYGPGNKLDESRDDLIRFLVQRNPKLRALFDKVLQICVCENGKLLVLENVPIYAKFQEDALPAEGVLTPSYIF